MTDMRKFHILVLCTGNSARSIMAEAILNHLGKGRIKAMSAGSRPTGMVHPMAIRALQMAGIDEGMPRSKSWDEFAAPDAPHFDLVITVCSNAAGEICPIWHGAPTKVHLGLPDPVMIDASQTQMSAAFEGAVSRLSKIVKDMLALPLEDMGSQDLREAISLIGRKHGAEV